MHFSNIKRVLEMKLNQSILCFTFPFIAFWANANDSAGYISTGGVEYIKNKNIQMYSENLFISKKKIKIDYQFKNLSQQNVTETILFPLPKILNFTEGDALDTQGVLKTFKIVVDGQNIQPKMHVRTFLYDKKSNKDIDITSEFKQCGFSEKEMLNPWKRSSIDYEVFEDKLRACKNAKLAQVLKQYNQNVIPWSSQIIYSWQQTFKANAVTHIQHQYEPLIGGGVYMDLIEDKTIYCMDKSFLAGLKKSNKENSPYHSLGYILTTGANWAKPITDFKITIERDVGELVSFCWDGAVKKISPTQFQMIEKNFTPKQDLNIIFVQ